MNKAELIEGLTARLGDKKVATTALEGFIDIVERAVAKGEKVSITGFGSFEKRVRDARWVRNPRTGERIKAKKTAIPKFSAGADLKAVVSGAKKLPKLTLTSATGGAKKAASASKSTTAKKSAPAKKATTAKKAPAKKTAAKKTTAAKSTAKKASPAKKTTAKKAPAKKSTAKKTAKKS